MKTFIALILFFLSIGKPFAQKPVIDSAAYLAWPSVGDAVLSPDGESAAVILKNEPVGSHSLLIRQLQGNRQMKIPRASNPKITADSKLLLFSKGRDSLGIVTLYNDSVSYLAGITSFELAGDRKIEYLLYGKTAEDELVLRDMETNAVSEYKNVKSYHLSPNGKAVLLVHPYKKDGLEMEALEWIDLPELTRKTIFEGHELRDFIFDGACRQLCFMANDSDDERGAYSIWYYQPVLDKAELLVSAESMEIDSNLEIAGIFRFRTDGKELFFDFKQRARARPKASGVDIWSYMDTKLQSQQLVEMNGNNTGQDIYGSIAVVDITKGHIKRLACENDQVLEWHPVVRDNEFKLLAHTGGGDRTEASWNRKSIQKYYLVSTVDGRRKELNLPFNSSGTEMSPEGKYVVYFDPNENDYFSFEIKRGVLLNLTSKIRLPWAVGTDPYIIKRGVKRLSIAGYLEGDTSMLMYSDYDVYEVSLNGAFAPINLTAGYGRKYGIQFRTVRYERDSTFKPHERIILNAFDKNSKKNGFYAIRLDESKAPEKLSMQDCMFQGAEYVFRVRPIRAMDTSVFLVLRMNSNESPNYYKTTDFRSFEAITDLHPEKAYNWQTTELVTWKTTDGTTCQGILYKPENFDPEKKYPIIFYYYEKRSDLLHLFIQPGFSPGTLNIPEYASNGYLVFTPDIHYVTGKPGPSALNSVVSAARYLMKKSWVDSTRMGIQGHSFGGFETYYIVTHSRLFAAAEAAEGMTDMISSAASMSGDGGCNQDYYEYGQPRMGASIWERPDLYVANSPIVYADRVTTPLLIMNNKNDVAVRFEQGFEMFTALRRLGKRVWMLQYDGNGHTVTGEASKDFTIRTRQFFDYYLKNMPAPRWLVEGIPAVQKGLFTGLELEDARVRPGPTLLVTGNGRKTSVAGNVKLNMVHNNNK